MGIVDKVKQGAGQAMTMASQAAERAKDEAKELNLKRQISNEEQRLGSIAIRPGRARGDLARGARSERRSDQCAAG